MEGNFKCVLEGDEELVKIPSKRKRVEQTSLASTSKNIKVEPMDSMHPLGTQTKVEPVDALEHIETGEFLQSQDTEPIESVEFVDIKEETNIEEENSSKNGHFMLDNLKINIPQSRPIVDNMDKCRRYTIEEDQAIYTLSNYIKLNFPIQNLMYRKCDISIEKIISYHIVGRDENDIKNRLANVISKNNFLYSKPTLLFEIELEHTNEKMTKGLTKMITILTQFHMIVLKCKTTNGSSCIYPEAHPDICIKMQYDSSLDFGIDERLLFNFLQKNVPKNLKIPTDLTKFQSLMIKSGISFHSCINNIKNPSIKLEDVDVKEKEEMICKHQMEEKNICEPDLIESKLRKLELKKLKARVRYSIKQKDKSLKKRNIKIEEKESKKKLEREQQLAKCVRDNCDIEDLDFQIRKIESKLQKLRTPDEKYILQKLKQKKRRYNERLYKIKEDQAIFALKYGTGEQKNALKKEMENIILQHEDDQNIEMDNINFEQNNEINLFLKKEEEIDCQPYIKPKDLSSEEKEDFALDSRIREIE